MEVSPFTHSPVWPAPVWKAVTLVDKPGALEVGDECFEEILDLPAPHLRGKGLAEGFALRRDLAFAGISLHPPVTRLHFEIQAQMKAGVGIDRDNALVAGRDGGKIETVRQPGLGSTHS